MDKDQIKKGLITLFEDMLKHGKEFKRSKYATVYEEGRRRHRKVVDAIADFCAEAQDGERDALIEEFASVIPEYAYEQMQSVKKSMKNKRHVDFNMNMAVYVVPIINHSRKEDCVAVAGRMVELWNEKGVTPMQLSYSTYEDIAAGFERRFCYITTAVCDSQNKPDDCYELTAFRNFRDEYMLASMEGRKLVEEYYEIAPGIVLMINMQKDAKEIYHDIYRKYLLPCLSQIEAGDKKACREHYASMVRELEEKYLCS